MNHIRIVDDDITVAKADAIVNAANPKMLGGGGVDGAIHRAAGPKLLEECRKVKAVNGIRCPFGSAKITAAGALNAKYVIHAVGPIYRNESDPEQVLKQTYERIFSLAREYGCQSLAMPAISCGAYGFPLDKASAIALTVCSLNPELEIAFYLLVPHVIQAWENSMLAIEK